MRCLLCCILTISHRPLILSNVHAITPSMTGLELLEIGLPDGLKESIPVPAIMLAPPDKLQQVLRQRFRRTMARCHARLDSEPGA